jgi:branched-chain amino acid transport system permease protein
MVVLGVVTVLVALYARGGAWGLICRFGDAPWFPVGRRLVRSPD